MTELTVFLFGWIAGWAALLIIGMWLRKSDATQQESKQAPTYPCEICGQVGAGSVARISLCHETGELRQQSIILCRDCLNEELEQLRLKGDT